MISPKVLAGVLVHQAHTQWTEDGSLFDIKEIKELGIGILGVLTNERNFRIYFDDNNEDFVGLSCKCPMLHMPVAGDLGISLIMTETAKVRSWEELIAAANQCFLVGEVDKFLSEELVDINDDDRSRALSFIRSYYQFRPLQRVFVAKLLH